MTPPDAELRVDQLAARADVSVDTIRFYQAKGLLAPPRRQGRVAWYGAGHLATLERIRLLRDRGLSLATIRRLLAGELDAADEALATALSASTAGPRGPGPGIGNPASRGPGSTPKAGSHGDPAAPAEDLLSLEELAERTDIPVALLAAIEREGLLVPRRVGERSRYTQEDVDAARAGLRLLEVGLPLAEVLALARQHHRAMREVAEAAVSLFDAHIRQPIRRAGLPDALAAQQMVEAFLGLLPATNALVAHHFRRTLLAVAQGHIEQVGNDAEVRAVRDESARWAEPVPSAPEADPAAPSGPGSRVRAYR